MIAVIAATLVGTVVFAFCQSQLMRQLRRCFAQPAAAWPAGQPWPKAAVILSLRGNDPFLKSCLQKLLEQDYPDYVLHIIVDSPSDPAWDAIHAVQAEYGSKALHAAVLEQRRSSCSLKNSSIIQAVNGLPGDCEVVAFVDADALPHASWLRELVTPLADPDVGCTTGIRWFAPPSPNFATRMRCFWNLTAAAVIYQSNTPWGGSMVVRRSVLDSGLTTEWSKMLCEDAHTINHLQQRGLKVVCVAAATVVNPEATTVAGCLRFVNRQMLIFRLYHRQWAFVVTLILSAAVLRIANIHFFVQALLRGDWASFLALFGIYALVPVVTRYEAARLDEAVRRTVAKNGQEIPHNPTPDSVGYFCTEILFLTSTLSALASRSVNWRGISYRINGPSDIMLLNYRPFIETPAFAAEQHSTVV